jgi:hypothetical protein
MGPPLPAGATARDSAFGTLHEDVYGTGALVDDGLSKVS